jgi:hypothetical protein
MMIVQRVFLIAASIFFLQTTVANADVVVNQSFLDAEFAYSKQDYSTAIIRGSAGAIFLLQKISPKFNNRLRLSLLFIKQLSRSNNPRVQKNVAEINHHFLKQFLIPYDVKDDYEGSNGIETIPALVWDSPRYSSISIEVNVSNMTERYFQAYYLIDKRTGKLVSPKQAIARFGFSNKDIQNAIYAKIKPCIDTENSSWQGYEANKKFRPVFCDDVVLNRFVVDHMDDIVIEP